MQGLCQCECNNKSTYLGNGHAQEVKIGYPLKLLKQILRDERQEVVLKSKGLLCNCGKYQVLHCSTQIKKKIQMLLKYT